MNLFDLFSFDKQGEVISDIKCHILRPQLVAMLSIQALRFKRRREFQRCWDYHARIRLLTRKLLQILSLKLHIIHNNISGPLWMLLLFTEALLLGSLALFYSEVGRFIHYTIINGRTALKCLRFKRLTGNSTWQNEIFLSQLTIKNNQSCMKLKKFNSLGKKWTWTSSQFMD